MLPEPLHPAVVHIPIALTLILPLAALVALFIRSRGARWGEAWLPVVVAAAALVLSSWIALETGEEQEDVVEAVVSEHVLEGHEERAEVFMQATILLFLLTAGALVPGTAGTVSRVAAGAGMALVLYLGFNVGHSGGELVYRHGAAQVYSDAGGAAQPSAFRWEHPRDDD